jgi:hypothetical protein
MRDALKTIAGYLNSSKPQDGSQAAARLARHTLDELDLFSNDSASRPDPGSTDQGPRP